MAWKKVRRCKKINLCCRQIEKNTVNKLTLSQYFKPLVFYKCVVIVSRTVKKKDSHSLSFLYPFFFGKVKGTVTVICKKKNNDCFKSN